MKTSKAGFTLVELIIAMSLSMLVILALTKLTTMAVHNHTRGVRSAASQLEAALLFKTIEHDLAGATYLVTPAAADTSGSRLEVCSNAMRGATAAEAPVPIDAGKPVRFSAFCQSGNNLYYHTLAGCPAVYSCGTDPAMTFGTEENVAAALFKRASLRSPVVEVTIAVSSKDHPVRRSASFALAYAVGGGTPVRTSEPSEPGMGTCTCMTTRRTPTGGSESCCEASVEYGRIGTVGYATAGDCGCYCTRK